MTLVAICRPRYPHLSPEIVDLTKIDLRLQVNRLKHLIRMINLCSLIVPITTAIGMRTTIYFVTFRRWESLFAHVSHRLIHFFCHREGKVVELCGRNIKMTFEGPERYAKLRRLKGTYDLLMTKGVPNVDSISASFADDTHNAVIFLEPKGLSVLPMNGRQLLEAVCCILEALVVSPFTSVDPNIMIVPFEGYA